MTAEHAGPVRAPLSESALTRALIRPGGFWSEMRVVQRTGSTNADLLAQAADGAPEGSVLVAEAQTAGRGRLGRTWVSPPRAALTFSVLLRPGAVPPARCGWIPLLAGLAVAAAVRDVTGLDARLKWPNDVLIGGRKLAGILAERSAAAVVVGAGINVTTSRAELPVETATSLAIEGAAGGTGANWAGGVVAGGMGSATDGSAQDDRHRLLCAVLGELERRYLAWTGTPSPGDPEASGLAPEYRRRCHTLGRPVRAELPGREAIWGTATDIDSEGRLLLRTADGQLAVSAADIIHLRPS
ncbi:MAG TPA: biotin--[acetyl-CoA-carboxylase] ligase [Streptosporangiaceae bacterium]|jgi:BirA family biotin operon repressor/biotin-[acetyl-CoA-carboxylase] ligase